MFALRAGGPWIVVYDAKQIDDSHITSRWEYTLHWTGQEWQNRTGGNAFVYDYRQYAEEDIENFGSTMVARLPPD